MSRWEAAVLTRRTVRAHDRTIRLSAMKQPMSPQVSQPLDELKITIIPIRACRNERQTTAVAGLEEIFAKRSYAFTRQLFMSIIDEGQ